MIPTIAEVRTHANGFLKVLQAFAIKEFDLNVDNMVFKLDFRTDSATFGVGGNELVNGKRVGYMRLNLKRLVNSEVRGYNEYKSLLKYTDISSFETTDWKIWLEALMCHEMAHVIQFMLPYSNSKLMIGEAIIRSTRLRTRYVIKTIASFKGLGVSEDGHKDFFKSIYVKLRKQFINARVTPAYRSLVQFVDETGEQVVRVRPTSNHPLIGVSFTYKGETYKVTECFPRMRTYPLLAVGQKSGKRCRFSVNTVRMYAAAENVRLTDNGLTLTNNPFAKAA